MSSLDLLLSKLDLVQRSGEGYRAPCPACGGRSRKLAVRERDGRVLVHCFGCNDAEGVLAAVGLRWADLRPSRHWPLSPIERKAQNRAIRETGIGAAVEVLSLEAVVIQLASKQLQGWQPLSVEDDERLALACNRIGNAAVVLTGRESYRPDNAYQPARLAAIKSGVVSELRRQLALAEQELRSAESALQEFKNKHADGDDKAAEAAA